MWLLIFITIAVLFFAFGYWYKYKCTDQIDKIIMNPTKQMLCLLLCVFLVFAFLLFIGSYALDDTKDISAIVMLYGLFSQTTSAYNPDISTDLQIYSLFVSVLGAVFFSVPLFHRQQCAHNVLFGYTAVKKEELNFKTKEIYHLLPYSEIKDCKGIVGSYKRFYKDIKTWLELNNQGLKSCKK